MPGPVFAHLIRGIQVSTLGDFRLISCTSELYYTFISYDTQDHNK